MPWLLLLIFFSPNTLASDPISYESGGHFKTRGQIQTFPDDSLYNEFTGSSTKDLNMDLRLLFRADKGPWDFRTDAQLLLLYGDTVEYTRSLAEQAPLYEQLFGRLPNDDRRWWNLTKTIQDTGKQALIGRLDRLSAGFTAANYSMRFGRQAISWGNGLVYTPMDIVNPFDPTQVDTEYKSGDDMLSGQYLRENGDDIQAAYVIRRNPVTHTVESDQATLAVKYHGFLGSFEYDALAARHYAQALFAMGGNRDIGGSVWRSDLVLSATEDDKFVAQFIVNTSYSWVWGRKNYSGSAEYFFNGFGQDDGCYSPTCLAENPDLLERVARRQVFTLGRHYLGGSLSVEITPLFTLTPNLFWNLGDDSALLQLVTQNSLSDNLVLLGALSVPIGSNGTEYGGIATDVPGTYFSSELSLFLQLGWYF